MAPVAKRCTIDSTGSTSSSGTGGRTASSPVRSRSRPRKVASRSDWSSTSSLYSLKTSKRLARVACCSLNTVFGLNRWYSPSRRHLYSPPTADLELARARLGPFVGIPVAPGHLLGELVEPDAAEPARRAAEVAVDERPVEADRLEDLGAGVRGDRRDAHLGHHLQDALAGGLQVLAARALRSDSSPSRPSRTISPTESRARYGFTAAAP